MALIRMSEAQVLGLKTACRKLMGKAVQQTRAKQFLDQEDERDVKDAVALVTMHVSDKDQQALVSKFVSWKIKPLHFIPESSPSTIRESMSTLLKRLDPFSWTISVSPQNQTRRWDGIST